eukprot:TRINITY_DN11779_c0_g1_i5.p1 TRINITY_DN11779_c0_g1~~TRINITY_DN11779_c0_g1_i5.p1  ORF type:complete len:418 (-),score=110.98 TRINITY_DN11779_c0_g1_i5:86-1339(-)
MRKIEEKLKNFSVEELSMFYNFFHIAALVLNGRYSKAKELLENSGLDLDELLFLKTFVYEKLQIFTSHKICFDMLSSEFQGRYRLIAAKDGTSPEVKGEIEKLVKAYELERSDLLACKKTAWKELLVKASENLKQILCKHVAENKKLYNDCEAFEDLVLGEKSLRESLLNMGHMIRVWLLMPNHAITFYEQVAALNPNDPVPYFFLGVTFRGKGENKKAIDAYMKALELNPDYPDCLFNLGNIFFEFMKNLPKAEECYRKALKLLMENKVEKPIVTKGRVYNLLGELERKRNNIPLSIESYLNGIRDDWRFIDNYKDLAEVLRELEVDQLESIVKVIGSAMVSKEQKLSTDYISQLAEAAQENLKTKSRDSNVLEVFKKMYEMIETLRFTEDMEEDKRAFLKDVAVQLSFIHNLKCQ